MTAARGPQHRSGTAREFRDESSGRTVAEVGIPMTLTDRAASRVLDGKSRRALLAAIEEAGQPLDTAQAAALVGLHQNAARVQLDMLCAVGLLKRRFEQRTRRGRPRVLYELAPDSLDLARHRVDGRARENRGYRDLARALAAQLVSLPNATFEAVRSGRRLASMLDLEPLPRAPIRQRDVMSTLGELLSELGFDPRPESLARRIALQSCPFAEVACEQRAMICAIHLGMLEAVIERLGAAIAIEGLEASVGGAPNGCVICLGSPQESDGPRKERGRGSSADP